MAASLIIIPNHNTLHEAAFKFATVYVCVCPRARQEFANVDESGRRGIMHDP